MHTLESIRELFGGAGEPLNMMFPSHINSFIVIGEAVVMVALNP